jgi:hypothetical protein
VNCFPDVEPGIPAAPPAAGPSTFGIHRVPLAIVGEAPSNLGCVFFPLPKMLKLCMLLPIMIYKQRVLFHKTLLIVVEVLMRL